MKLRKGQIFCFWKQMKIRTKCFTSSKSTVARILNKRCAEESYREDQVKARNQIAPPANVPQMLEIEQLLTRIVNKVSAWVAVWTRCKQAGGRPDLHKIWSERDLDTSNMQCRGFRQLQSLSKHCSTLGLGPPSWKRSSISITWLRPTTASNALCSAVPPGVHSQDCST